MSGGVPGGGHYHISRRGEGCPGRPVLGVQLCTIACPYGTIFYDVDTKKAFKCNLCGGSPACAEACPTAAIQWVEAEVQDWQGDFAETRGNVHLVGFSV